MIWVALWSLILGCAPQDYGVSDVSFHHSPYALGTATISWKSDQVGDGYVKISSQDGNLYAPFSTTEQTNHEVEIRGLPLGQTLTYSVHTDASSGDALFSAPRGEIMPGPESLGIPRTFLEIHDTSLTDAEGYRLISLNHKNGTSSAVILDKYANIVWAPITPFESATTSAKLTENGDVVAMQNLMDAANKKEWCTITSLDGTQTTNSKPDTGHHDALVRDDHIISLGFEHSVVDIDGNPANVGSDTITSTPIGGDGSETSILFSFKDHYAAPWRPCEHYDNDAYNMTGVHDFTHSNSLVDYEDHLYIMSLHLDMVLKTKGAEIIWQFGGDLSDFTLKNPDNWFSHGHFSQVLPQGLLVFDNGWHREPNASRVIEYAIDEKTMTAEAVWIYEQPAGENVQVLGDAERLPNGNTLVAWSTLGTLSEVTPDGEVAWRARAINGHIARASYVGDLYDPTN